MEAQRFPLNSHQNNVLRGEFRQAEVDFSEGDYRVSMDNRLANLIFYLLEPESDDGLGFWNFFDGSLVSQLQSGNDAVFPVFKVQP